MFMPFRTAIDLTGKTFGRWTVLARAERPEDRNGRHSYWQCRCECGAERVVVGRVLRYGQSHSCGCLASEVWVTRNRTHGLSPAGRRHPLYATWANMKDRCHNPRSADWPNYGARGISVCDRWRFDFAAFAADVGERPPGTTLDRIDNDGNYEPSNVRWATPKQQRHNSRQPA